MIASNPAARSETQAVKASSVVVREVSEWAGHNSVAFTLTRYGGLFEDGSEAAVDRLDVLLRGASKDSDNVLQMNTRKLR
jgi:hypothetical protein